MRKLFLLFLLPLAVSAQQKQLTVEDAVMKQRTSLAPARLNGLAWIPGTNQFVYLGKKNNKDCVIRQDAQSMTRDTVLTVEKYNELLSKAVGSVKPADRLPALTWVSSTGFRFTHKQSIYVADVASGSVDVVCYLPESAEHTELEPVTGKVAYVYQHNVMVTDKAISGNAQNAQKEASSKDAPLAGGGPGKADVVTTNGKYGLEYGSPVHRNEFGIEKGLFWSPKGKRLAYYEMNEAPVTDYPIYDLSKKPAGYRYIKYPMAGAESHQVKLFVKDFVKNRTIEVSTGGPADQYLTNIAWHPGEEKIYIAIVNRAQNEMKLNEYDAVTGSFIKTLLTETHPKYVEPEHALVFCRNNPSQFIWMSERDGFNQLYLYSTNGRMLKQLTTGKSDVTQFLGFNGPGTAAYYMAASEDGMNRYAYSVDLKTGKSMKMTAEEGVHSVMMNDEGTMFLDVFSSAAVPRRTVLKTVTGEEKELLLGSPNPLGEYQKCEMRLGRIKAADGTTDLNYRLFLPPSFNEGTKYPVLVYLYGGPHAQLVTNSWLGGSDMWLYYMAQQGYVVFTMDNRGSANRGLGFENATFRKLGVEERADQMKGVEFLKSLPYTDASRMGVFGWSFGGFMATGLMSKADVFKAGVAGGPVIDWGMYEIMYTERYMDTPKENPEGYEESNLMNSLKNLKGKLMLIHGTDDETVLWQHSLQYIKKCVDEGIQVDYFAYPGHLHNVTGKDRVHLMQKISDYFKQNL